MLRLRIIRNVKLGIKNLMMHKLRSFLTVLGMVFGVGQGSIFAWQTWLMVFVLALVPVLVFFLNMLLVNAPIP